VLEPEILLLDEPFAALDPASRDSLLEDFQHILNESKLTTVFVTHDRNEAFSLAGKIAVLHQGRLAQIGSRGDVFHRPASEIVANIVGRFEPGTRVVVCLRPESLIISRDNFPTRDSNRLTGIIKALSTGLMQQRITLDCDGMPVVALIERQACANLKLAEREMVTITFSFSAAHIIISDNDIGPPSYEPIVAGSDLAVGSESSSS
jgi:ABC-type proline/glycine betaine transport system ATPase subunit